jgi:riboflavin transporter FmnP
MIIKIPRFEVLGMAVPRGRFDSVSIAGIAVFSSLAILLSATSQAMGLNFPIIPYLQFDLGEIAVVMAFYVFGPGPASISSFVEFVGLEAYGLNRPIGPLLKLLALLSTVGGLWLGTRLTSTISKVSMNRVISIGAVSGAVTRAVVMTIANYYLVTVLYGLSVTATYYNLAQTFSIVGIALTNTNTLFMILAFTAVFNTLQLGFVVTLAYTVIRFPPFSNLKVGGRAPWFLAVMGSRAKPEETTA